MKYIIGTLCYQNNKGNEELNGDEKRAYRAKKREREKRSKNEIFKTNSRRTGGTFTVNSFVTHKHTVAKKEKCRESHDSVSRSLPNILLMHIHIHT